MQLQTFTSGSGPGVLFLHGIGSSGTAWQKITDLIDDDYRCLALDLPGYGDSAALEDADLDEVCEAVVGAMNGRPHHVVGVSFGALTALRLARQHAGMVQSLTLADATLGRGYLPLDEKQAWLSNRQALSTGLQTLAHERARQIAAPSAGEDVVQEIARHMQRAHPEGYMAVARIIAATDAREWLDGIRQPALVLYGEEDAVTGAEMSNTLSQALANATIACIPQAGHAPHIERPEAFAGLLRAFLRTIDPVVRRL